MATNEWFRDGFVGPVFVVGCLSVFSLSLFVKGVV